MSIPLDQMDDPWTLQPGMPVVMQPEPPALQIETIEGVVPLDDQIGAFPKQTVPEALHEALFGQPEPSEAEIGAAGGDPAQVPPLQTYAILDAAKVTNLPELLERSGLDHRCLFKGAAYDEMKNVAPWIVRLEEGNAFTRHLFTRSGASWHLWDREPGIYIRSRGTLDELVTHYRRFVRVRREDGSWNYFRFWDAAILPAHCAHIADQPEELSRWFRMSSGNQIHALLALRANGRACTIAAPADLPAARSGSFTLKEAEVRSFRQLRLQSSKADISDRLRKHVPELEAAQAGQAIDDVISRFSSYGFRSKASIFTLAWWELKYGPGFELNMAPQDRAGIQNENRDEALRMADINSIMEELNEKECRNA